MNSSSSGIGSLVGFSQSIADLVDLCLPRTCTILVRSADLLGRGNGSGWCFSDRHIVTNHHVVEGTGGLVNVRFPHQPPKRGRVVGSDPLTDLAVIEVDSCSVNPFQVRVDPPIRTGEVCFTMGAPDGLEESVSMGIISGLHRQIEMADVKYEEAIQVDAAINPGNSGGPLLDSTGNVIGVNFLKNLGRSAREGNPLTLIAFAISGEVVVDIVPELVAHGQVQRGALGVSISQIATEIDGSISPAIEVQNAAQSSPFMTGDLILSCNGTPLRRRYDLMRMLNRGAIGSQLRFDVRRSGEAISVSAEVREKSSST